MPVDKVDKHMIELNVYVDNWIKLIIDEIRSSRAQPTQTLYQDVLKGLKKLRNDQLFFLCFLVWNWYYHGINSVWGSNCSMYDIAVDIPLYEFVMSKFYALFFSFMFFLTLVLCWYEY